MGYVIQMAIARILRRFHAGTQAKQGFGIGGNVPDSAKDFG